MTNLTYAAAGVDIKKGDSASKSAYKNAQKTFPSREGLIGAPVKLEGGFTGALDFGDFYLIQNDDGTGSKSEIAEMVGNFDTIGQDLVAMVADDAICVGAETISITNTFDVPSVDPEVLNQMTASLSEACVEQKIVIPGGEIAEVPGAAKKIIWNATAVGVVKKEKFLTGKNIQPGQKIIGLYDPMLRSNGMSLARKILETKLGENWSRETFEGQSWGEILLTPSKIFHRLILDEILGDFQTPRKFDVSGVCHITGGGIPGNVPRILPEGCGAQFDHLHEPNVAIKALQELGNIEEKECYQTWHCGTAMMIFCEADETEKICENLNKADSSVQAQVVGKVTGQPGIEVVSGFSGEKLSF